jgi:hypothetical protein
MLDTSNSIKDNANKSAIFTPAVIHENGDFDRFRGFTDNRGGKLEFLSGCIKNQVIFILVVHLIYLND